MRCSSEVIYSDSYFRDDRSRLNVNRDWKLIKTHKLYTGPSENMGDYHAF